MSIPGLPHYAEGEIIKGFGRGSKQLGIPTANYPEEVINSLPNELSAGIYSGFACVNDGPVYRMVMSVGWNPQYNNEKKSMETHIIHKFDQDFYGEQLKVLMVNYLRPEKRFNSLDELIAAIIADIQEAENTLGDEQFQKYKSYFPHATNLAQY